MNWKDIKEKILIFGEEDYVFADMFVAIVNELNTKEKKNVHDDTLNMLYELLRDRLVDVFILRKEKKEIIDIIKYNINDEKDIIQLLKTIKDEWKLFNYDLPQPNQLFWVTTTDKGIGLIDNEE
ncbi:hypothetical protein [Paenimyroides ceti]